MPEPYYQDEAVTLYHGEALALIPHVGQIDGLIADPPYSSGGAFRGDRMLNTNDKYVQGELRAYRAAFAGDNRDQRSFLAWCALWMAAALSITNDGATCAIFTDWRQLPTTSDALQAGGWVWRGLGVWDKTPAARPRLGGLAAQSEFICWGTAGPLDAQRNPVALPGVMSVGAPRGESKVHVAQKPESVMSWLVRLVPPGGVVLDPFAGSGSTLVAAKALGRRAVGIEIDERYCSMIAERCAQAVMPLESPPVVEESLPI